ncbi:MAG: GTPase [Nanoarchaeota archaeon]
MPGSFWRHVNTVLKESDIIIEVLDARMIEETRHWELEDKVRRLGKILLYVVTKCDLEQKEVVEQRTRQLHPSVFISARDKLGTTILKHKILELAKGKKVVVGVVGYPNVGKSSLINALAGRNAARTSARSGYTKGVQKVRLGAKLALLDTPGVFPSMEKDTVKYAKTAAIDSSKIRDPEVAALKIIEENMSLIKTFYGVSGDEPEEVLEHIAEVLHRLTKGGKPDLEVTARLVLQDWQRGKIHKTTY